ncbi:putative calmodulin-binding protein Sha1 [Aspergillus melleus]|uniref:putative calmodulin-binding protein Sha1 n=1 Tax=Aspergillus melleus TaxID=138277 RepID=UPI001E8DD39D|nr:uncharacterized protein LDX57_000305 [Aspergillus melleus]KAH8422552.1 hypothetical protein LDX57_000305 [Aspergillus melleus]
MSGLLEDVPTPCPSRLGTFRVNRSSEGNDSIYSIWEDSLDSCEDTANIEFTTEIRAPVLTGAKPRRRTKTSSSSSASSFAIHDECEEKHAAPTTKRRKDSGTIAAPSNRKSSLLAQPAQRFRPKVSLAANSPAKQTRSQGEMVGRTQPRKVDVDKNKELLMRIKGVSQQARASEAKDVHHDAVYVPPSEPRGASSFMDMFSPLKSEYLPGQSENTNEARVARKRQTKPSLAASPHRAPLQPSAKISQESRIHVDVVGKNGGKENIPPGTLLVDGKEKKFPLAKSGDIFDEMSKAHKPAASKQTRPPTKQAVKPLAAKSVNGSLQRAMNNVKRSSVKAGLKDNVKPKMTTTKRPLSASTGSTLSSSLKRSKGPVATSRATASRTNTKKLDREYPLIKEDIKNPALYEDNWLSHQEIVITQLVNGLFESAENSTVSDPVAQRHSFLALYQHPSFAHLYKRVQASLLYGALSIPKDVLARTTRLKQDLGMKKKYLDFWVNTYELGVLKVGLETITGRRLSGSKETEQSTAADDSSLKRKIERFLDLFLLQNQDMDRDTKESDAKLLGKAYHRTVFRSIMLIILLDKAATESEAKPPRLFLLSSPYKSSAAVFRGLARFLLPSSGDVIKALNHLDCHLTYEQRPIQEYEYRINNLAVDLRDGVRLTRVMELLLFPRSGNAHSECLWPLSQNLKFPCLSRAVKTFNVAIALNALTSMEGSRGLLSNVRAEDIVNGHREKTISLLWGLVSKWGLDELVNWNDLTKEIQRLKLKASQQFGYEQVVDKDWFRGDNLDMLDERDAPVLLLKQWASILAHLKGLQLNNLSTSFGDGKIYQSIVDEYAEYILHEDPDPLTSGQPLSLQSRLQALGCSAHFANLLHPSTSKIHILDNDFTIGALSFLCSRLLSASKRAGAATVLQQAWRRNLARRDLHRRIVARDFARQCAAVVQTKERIWATSVILHWWRNVKAKQQLRNG